MTADPDYAMSDVEFAQAGDRHALERILALVRNDIHHLALRFLANPADAEEATQEILLRLTVRLGSFEGRSKFATWAHRVAVNYLIDVRKAEERNRSLTFEAFETDLMEGLTDNDTPGAEEIVFLDQLRVSCTMAMLLCLKSEARMAYVLGDIMEFEHTEAAEMLGITPTGYRQRLSRARKAVVDFTGRMCGVGNPAGRCNCRKRLPAAIALGRVGAHAPTITLADTRGHDELAEQVKGLNVALRTLKLQTSVGRLKSNIDIANMLSTLLAADNDRPDTTRQH